MEIPKKYINSYIIEWRLDGKLHRENGPAASVWFDGTEQWYLHDKPHRIGGPARIWEDGSMGWYLHGKLHRDIGPAVVYPNGTMEWWRNGELLYKISSEES